MPGKQLGGRRPGAGRPPLAGERLSIVKIGLTPAQVTWLHGLEWGSLSATVRRLVEREMALDAPPAVALLARLRG